MYIFCFNENKKKSIVNKKFNFWIKICKTQKKCQKVKLKIEMKTMRDTKEMLEYKIIYSKEIYKFLSTHFL